MRPRVSIGVKIPVFFCDRKLDGILHLQPLLSERQGLKAAPQAASPRQPAEPASPGTASLFSESGNLETLF